MTVMLDTCGLLFWLLAPDRLSPRASALIADRATRLVWSTASTWEVVIKARTGRLDLGGDVEIVLAEHLVQIGVRVLPVEQAHALQVARLPEVEWVEPSGAKRRHADPFDRLLVAQAMVERLPILTADAHFDAYPIERVW